MPSICLDRSRKWKRFAPIIHLNQAARRPRNRVRLVSRGMAEGKSDMARIGTRAEVWFSNVVASFARYVAERTLPESVPMLMRRDAVVDSFNYAKENMKGAYSFLDRFEGLWSFDQGGEAKVSFRKLVLEFGVYKGGMINYQARKFPGLKFVGFDSFEGLQEQWSGMAPEKTSISAAGCRGFDAMSDWSRDGSRIRRRAGNAKSRLRHPAIGACRLRYLRRNGRRAGILRRLCGTWVWSIHFDDYLRVSRLENRRNSRRCRKSRKNGDGA